MTASPRPAQPVCLLLADLSGYTAYLAASEPERAPAMAADLVETVVRQLRPTFRLEKLEGDAAFMVAPLEGLTGAAVLDAIDATTAAFRARLRSMAQATTCACEACRRVPELDLKFVVHAGSVVHQRVAGRTELAGTDVIVAHRLLKAETPARFGLVRYALLTDAVVQSIGVNPEALGLRTGVERFDFLGELKVPLLDLAPRFTPAPLRTRAHSAKKVARSTKFLRANPQVTPSTDASGTGSTSTSDRTRGALVCAEASIPADTSNPTGRYPTRLRSSHRSPVPQARSITSERPASRSSRTITRAKVGWLASRSSRTVTRAKVGAPCTTRTCDLPVRSCRCGNNTELSHRRSCAIGSGLGR